MAELETNEFTPLRKSDVLACQFSSWYPRFKRHAPRATIIKPIPHEEELIEYLESDGLFLPEGSGPNGEVLVPFAFPLICFSISELSDSDNDEDEEPESDDEDSEPVKQFSFPQLDAEIRSVLDRYEGAVFPKLNWSSPQDAAWMIPGQNLKCQNPADVYLLLKSSDFISHDLDHAFDGCIDHEPSTLLSSSSAPTTNVDDTHDVAALSLDESAAEESESSTTRRILRPYSFELVLKKWFDMPKSQEWRCFVKDKQLLGISQRDTTFYDFLQPESAQKQILTQVSSFWSEVVREEFPLSDYTMDVYLTRDQSRTFIIDFNPFSPSTDPLLFSYPELSSLLSSNASSSTTTTIRIPILRVVESETSAGTLPRFSHNRYPKDVVELSEGQSVAEFAKVWGEKLKDAAVGGNEGHGESKGTEEGGRRDKGEEIVGR